MINIHDLESIYKKFVNYFTQKNKSDNIWSLNLYIIKGNKEN